MTTTEIVAKDIRKKMREISNSLNKYMEARKDLDKARTNYDYDAALQRMQESYTSMTFSLTDILDGATHLGHMSDALNIDTTLEIVGHKY